ncbi:MAG: hypothetical protein ABR518_08100 [Actinomycetota bacterium]
MSRLTPLRVYGGGFVFLLGAGAAVALSHFTASRLAPWISIGCSGAAVALTVGALVMSRTR